MLKIVLFIGLIHLFTNTLICQNPPELDWSNTYDYYGDDNAKSVLQTTEGGYIMAGSTWTSGSSWDMLIIKTDENGNEEWYELIGGIERENANSIKETQDNGFIVVGNTSSFGNGGKDFYLVKIDQSGGIEWFNTFGSVNDDIAYDICSVPDGFIITGNSDGDILVIKVDVTGNLIWQSLIGGDSADYAYSISNTNDYGCIIAGMTFSYGAGSSDIWVIKLDTDGNMEWDFVYGNSYSDKATSVIEANDSGYLVAGYTENVNTGDIDYLALKLDCSGTIEWNYSNPSDLDEYAQSVLQLSDNGYVIAGYVEINDDDYDDDIKVVKIDSNGNEEWSFMYGDVDEERAYDIYETSDQGLIVSGYQSDLITGLWDCLLLKYETATLVEISLIDPIYNLFNYPNPFNPSTTIEFSIQNDSHVELSIFNVKGQKVKTLISNEFSTGSHSIIWNGNDEFDKPISSGIYYYKLNINGKTEAVKKCLLMK